jgi:hypothetical protein
MNPDNYRCCTSQLNLRWVVGASMGLSGLGRESSRRYARVTDFATLVADLVSRLVCA